LAQFIADNYGDDLDIPDVQPGRDLSVDAMNRILKKNLVHGYDGCCLRTFTTLQWESDLGLGRPKARCYPFDLDGHRFRGKNPQVILRINLFYIHFYIVCYIEDSTLTYR